MKKILLVSIIMTALLISLSVPVSAFNCKETVNPHGDNVPPAGWSTEPGTNPNSGKNPDGFYGIFSNLPFEVGDVQSNGLPILDVEIWYGYLGDDDTEKAFGPFDPAPFVNAETPRYVVKFTEAPGVEPEQKLIGSNNGNENNNGQAGAVSWHFTVPDEPVCSVWVLDANGWSRWWRGICFVSPPPRGVP